MRNFIIKIIALGVFISCVTIINNFAVSEKTAQYAPIGTGLAIGALTSGFARIVTGDLMSVVVGVVVGGVSWFALKQYLSKLTPTSRIKIAARIIDVIESDVLLTCDIATIKELQLGQTYCRLEKLISNCQEVLHLIELAHKDCIEHNLFVQCKLIRVKAYGFIEILKPKLTLIEARQTEVSLRSRTKDLGIKIYKLEADPFLSYDFATTEDFVSYINMRFGTSWPLVLARNYVIGLTRSIESSACLIEKTLCEVLGKDLSDVAIACKELQTKTQLLINILIKKMNLITALHEYVFQVGLYENAQCVEHQRQYAEDLAKQQREHAERLARQQRELVKDLARQQSWERDHDRRLEREERERDRRLKEHAIVHGGKVTIKL